MRVPVIILNGFLGAGKTTLLCSLLVQAHQQALSVCVIVNDMSELDVDGVLIANTASIRPDKMNFITLSADTISSPDGITRLDAALTTLLARQQPDLILLETSGSSHPLPLIRYFRDQQRVVVKACLALVDSVMLSRDYVDGTALIPALEKNLRQGQRGVENLLAEQIMFCSHLLLTKNDRLSTQHVQAIAQQIHPLNPLVAVSAVPWGNLDLQTVLYGENYDFHRVARLITELQEDVDTPTGPTAARPIIARVLRDSRPFHPQRLWDVYHQFLGRGIYRSKGFFWLPGRDDLALLWNQAADSISLAFVSYWKAGILQHRDSPLTDEERALLREQLTRETGRFGDRRCRLTVIGHQEEVDPFVAALRRCFLTEEEIDAWEAGATFADPWPQRVARLTG